VREAVGVYESERALGITVRTGHSVVVLGYLGEPFHRLGARGVAVNDASLTAVGVGLAKRAQSRPGTATDWHVRWTGRTIVWHAGGALGVLGLSLGLTKVSVLLHGVVLSVLPATAARAVVALTICAGATSIVAGFRVFSALLEQQDSALLERI